MKNVLKSIDDKTLNSAIKCGRGVVFSTVSPRFTQETDIQRQAGYVDHHSLEIFVVKQCDRRI